jgi:SAM-dependent methyltransferase
MAIAAVTLTPDGRRATPSGCLRHQDVRSGVPLASVPMPTVTQRGSASIEQADYWWYRARTDLLRAGLEQYLGDPGRILDVGSADGPSVGWMEGRRRVQLDLDPRGLTPGVGVCGSALALPFADRSFDVVAAFDVLEHCEPEQQAVAELVRVLAPGGRLLLSVPAYAWAWTYHDQRAGHYRRYTRRRLLRAVDGHGLDVRRCSHAFAGTFPFFAAQRMLTRLRRATPKPGAPRLPPVSPATERVLLGLSRREERVLRGHDLPFGSSILLAAIKTGG